MEWSGRTRRIQRLLLALTVAALCCCSPASASQAFGLGSVQASLGINVFDITQCPTSGLVCDVLPTPAHASVKLSGDGDGRVAMTITCAPGLHVVGSAHMVCHPHGNGRPGGVWRIDASNTSRLATTPVCAECPSSEFSPSPTRSCYKLAQTRRGQYVTYKLAMQLCSEAGGALVAIDDEAEQQAIGNLVEQTRRIRSRIRDIIIGLVDRGGSDYRWIHHPAEKPAYTNWERDHPKTGLKAVVMESEGAEWISVNDSFIYGDYLCEQKAIIRCDDPSPVANGQLVYTTRSHPYRVNYACDPGHTLIGPRVFQCGASGQWTSADGKNKLPVCQPVTCPTPHHLNRIGIVSRHDETVTAFPYGSVIEYSCATGYKLKHTHANRTNIVTKSNGYRFASIECQANGQWSDHYRHHILKCESCSCWTAYTSAEVCDWVSGQCLCSDELNAEGKHCTECRDGYYRPGTDLSKSCQPCKCGVATQRGNVCHKKTGKCNCVPGCFGNCSIPQCNLYCDGEDLDTLQGVFEWPKTGVTAVATHDCPLGISRVCNDSGMCRGMAERRCIIENGMATWQRAETDDCSYADLLTEQINNLQTENISANNAADIADKLSSVANSKPNISSADISISTSLLERVVSTRSSDVKVGVGLLSTVSALGNASTEVLAEQGESNTTNRLLAVVDDYALNTPLNPGESSRRMDVSGIGMMLQDVDPAVVDDSVQIVDPNVAASLPDDLFNDGDVNHKIRLQATVFADSSLFVRRIRNPNLPIYNVGDDASTTDSPVTTDQAVDHRVSSNILSLTVADYDPRKPLKRPINLTFTQPTLPDNQARNPSCVFWNFSLNDWSSEGCTLVSQSSGNVDSDDAQSTLTCECTHLTHFAILMDFSPDKTSKHTVVLQWITYIGLALSLAGLIGTFIVFGCYPKLRRQQQMQILLQLCSAWTGVIVSFIIGGELADYPGACATFAVFTHYFLLVVFMWTLAQAVFLYMALVLVYTEGVKAKFRKAIVVCWSVPVLIVSITLGATKAEAYMPNPDKVNVCVLNIVNARGAFIGSYLVPICLILAANLVLFGLVLRRIIKPRPGMKKRQLEDHKRDLKISISLAVLLGLTWLTGIGIVGEARVAFSYIFTFLNAFLGFFIFVLHFALRGEVVDEFKRSVSNKRQSFASTRSSTLRKTFLSDTNSRSGGGGGGDSSFTSSTASTTGAWRPIKSVVPQTQGISPGNARKGSLESTESGDSSASDPVSQTRTISPEKQYLSGDDATKRPLATIKSDPELDNVSSPSVQAGEPAPATDVERKVVLPADDDDGTQSCASSSEA
ncbi:cadherin EGF LAG seven-pass G-type receptor 2-like [Sycon ciliatum]|uniref:cadherin EGF LAG seven-pass G-type receptor 2-like n=1 Tax=Sycon ciliatum TaxID=27933 RepID=UPI0031F6981C